MRWDAATLEASRNPAYWRKFFSDNPDALHKLLGDIYEIATAHSSENARAGRRTRTGAGSLDDLWQMLTLEASDLPFGEAFRKAAKDRSIRSIAPQVPCHFSHLASLVAGRRRLVDYNDMRGSMQFIERVAKALRVRPAYFKEWRELYVLTAVQTAISEGYSLRGLS